MTYFTREGRLRPHELPHVRFANERSTTIRYFVEKLPIGIEADGRTHVFLYLVTRQLPIDFRAFLHRHAEVLRTVAQWRIHLLLPRHLAGAAPRYEAALRDELASPLQSTTVDELKWFFERRRRADGDPSLMADVRYHHAEEVFATPRFRVLYRTWKDYGDAALFASLSPVLANALAERRGELACEVLPHPYQHLASLVGTA